MDKVILLQTDLRESVELKSHKTVVRVKTDFWHDNRGMHIKKSIMYLKRKSCGLNMLDESLSNIGAEETAKEFVNLLDVEDGIYQVVACNESRDWETGVVDDWDYKLIQYKEPEAQK